MDRWTIEYVDQLTREALERSFMERRRSVFAPSKSPDFDWDRVTGMVVRAWMYIRDHPSWLREVPFEETTEQFAILLGFAVEKTTTTGSYDQAGYEAQSLAGHHVSRQIAERELVTDFVNWSLQGVAA